MFISCPSSATLFATALLNMIDRLVWKMTSIHHELKQATRPPNLEEVLQGSTAEDPVQG